MLVTVIRCTEGLIINALDLTAFELARCFGDCNSFPLTFQQILTLKLVDGCNHCQHQLSRGSAGVKILLIRYKMHILSLQLLHNGKEVFGTAGKAAKVVDINGIAFPHIVQHGFQLWAVHVLAADLFREPLVDTVFLEGFNLPCLVLFSGGNSYISNVCHTASLSFHPVIISTFIVSQCKSEVNNFIYVLQNKSKIKSVFTIIMDLRM